jgi:hypothetical protein
MISNRDISIDRLIESMSRIDRMVYKTIEWLFKIHTKLKIEIKKNIC